MMQPSVTAYFATRKRPAKEELRNKAKVLLVGEHADRQVLGLDPAPGLGDNIEARNEPSKKKTEIRKEMVARNLQFDLGTKQTKPVRRRASKASKPVVKEDNRQPDIRETLLKVKESADEKKVVFAKLGNLSPKKSVKSRDSKAPQTSKVEEKTTEAAICKTPTKEPAVFKTPTKTPSRELNYNEIKRKVVTSARLAELRARTAQFQNLDKKLEGLEQKLKEKREGRKKDEEVKIKEFERIELEIPVSPHKALLSPNKFFSPTKTMPPLSPKASPARRLLFEPKEAPSSPVKASPTKAAAYQRFQSLVEDGKTLSLPYKYRFLAEVFRSIDTVAAMLYNRKETITFKKLRPAVQELVRRNFTLDHLAQIKTIYPEAYIFRQEKMRSFGTSNPEKYELVIVPNIEVDNQRSGRNTPDEENVIKSALNVNMNPNILLKRRHKFQSELLEIVKDEHEKFLQSLETPMNIPKDKITRWHPEFDVESCREIEKSDLPEEPRHEKLTTAKDVLERTNKFMLENTRMKKALELLADNQTRVDKPTNTDTTTVNTEEVPKLDSSVVDTPPATPKTQPVKALNNPALKGIPSALLEKIRAKQAAKALEMMTRSVDANKEAAMYARLPDMAKIVRNIFVSEKKNVLALEHVIKKLDDSYRTKLNASDLEAHLRLLCKLVPTWIAVHVVRKINYLKIAKDFDMSKIIHRLEVLANEKVE